MQWEDIKNKSKKDLEEILVEKRFEIQNLSFQAHGRQLKQVHKLGSLKKLISQINLLLQQRAEEGKNQDSLPTRDLQSQRLPLGQGTKKVVKKKSNIVN
ncbi:MAG: 50S ribosomal protein L29 [Parcubacteria group bacterium]|nr:50S ribosomal protein L29 [Parcubacteria group bacterium]